MRALVTVAEPGSPAVAQRLRAKQRWWGIAALALAVALALTTIGSAIDARVDGRLFVQSYALTNLVLGSAFVASGTVIARFQTRNVIGPLFVVGGLGHLLTSAATMIVFHGMAVGWPAEVLRALATVVTGAWQLGLPWLFGLAMLLFPTGHLPSPRWRPLAWLILVSGAYQLITGVLSDGSPIPSPNAPSSILSIGLELPSPVIAVMGLTTLVAHLLVVGSLVGRYVRGDEQLRRQLLWLILALLAATVINAQRLVTADGPIMFLLSLVLVPIAIGIAVVRYQLFDIRMVLSRTLVYGLALSVVIALYAGVVAGLSLLIPADAERGAAVTAAIVVAVCFNPLRLLVQRLVTQGFYGTRSDPAGTAWQIGGRLRRDDDLASLLDGTCDALRLPWTIIRRASDGAVVAASGHPNDLASTAIALRYHDESMGDLVVGHRRGDARLHDEDRRTIELIAMPLAVALHANALSEQVQRARAATVEAAAAERVSLQRELHDGLGPTLTSLTFTADAAANLVHTDSEEAERLLGEVRADLRYALDNLRNVVYGLRPIELDDLGLLGPLRQRIAALSSEARDGITVELLAPEQLPDLSPAGELAAYRIANEALTNVFRHSTGRRCVLTITGQDALVVEVWDDGTPTPHWHPGVGLRSITARAEELGGTASAGPTPTGWTVRSELPVRRLPLE
ncbi:MAG: two-component system, NarL family, sensor kinase [Propionibacteriaceae bacterium]|jgi:two-component system NarL family sensor kinase|nr:sensor histidine kinase [Propionibacteriaceae bacterium]MDX6320195.1 two-component system, NarL family, sensor kinase [Propionibacteriaceae bacterium]